MRHGRTGRMRRSIRGPDCSTPTPCTISRLIKFIPTEYKVGQRYIGLENKPAPPTGGPIAHVDAIHPITGQHAWRVPIARHPAIFGGAASRGRTVVHRQGRPASSSRSTIENGKTLLASSRPALASTRSDHVSPQRPAICRDPVRPRRVNVVRNGRGAQERAARWLGCGCSP